MGAALKLERFDTPLAALPLPLFTQDDLDAAFAAGKSDGRAEVEAQQAAELSRALAQLSAALQAGQGATVQASQGQMRALAPVLEALLDGVVPALARARLESALLAELMQLAQAVSPLQARIRCGPDLAAFAAACLAATGLKDIEIEADAPDGTIEADILGGLVTWDVARVTEQLRDLVKELMEM